MRATHRPIFRMYPPQTQMNVEIFIVSCAKHFPWLEYCLKSIEKFCTGFSGVTVLAPSQDDLLKADFTGGHKRFIAEEWPDKGMLWHMAQIMRADEWCPNADFILHTDSDCMFVEPVTPADYFENGKPILYHQNFRTLGVQHPDVLRWQKVVQDCVTFPVKQETMRRHPAVHHRKVYAKARQEIELKTKTPWDEYIKAQRNEFPQTFCEFVTLGNVAMRYFQNDYKLLDMEKNTWPPQKLVQFWSHSPPHIPQRPVYRGEPFECTPDYFLK